MNVAGALEFTFCRCPTPSQLAGHLLGTSHLFLELFLSLHENIDSSAYGLLEVNVSAEPSEARLASVTSALCLSGDSHVSKHDDIGLHAAVLGGLLGTEAICNGCVNDNKMLLSLLTQLPNQPRS